MSLMADCVAKVRRADAVEFLKQALCRLCYLESILRARKPTLTFSLLFAPSFPVTPKSFPVNFDNKFGLKAAWILRLQVDAIVNVRPNFKFSLYFSLLFRNFEFGDVFESDCVHRQRRSDPVLRQF
jgi:hypothetical protein